MCGIIGINTQHYSDQLIHNLMQGLHRLEYRGYDSAGIAYLDNDKMILHRAAGKLVNLQEKLQQEKLPSTNIGIAHTRWATHGVANEANAHPHQGKYVSVVHNGIIENYLDLKRLCPADSIFKSETDTEILVHLLDQYISDGLSPKEAFFKLMDQLQGAYAILAMFKSDPNHLYAMRQSSPLAIGHGNGGGDDGAMYVGSDAMALAHLTNKITYLENGDVAVVGHDDAEIYHDGKAITRAIRVAQITIDASGKGNYRHFMKKEIHEQPKIMADILQQRDEYRLDWSIIDDLTITACGSAYLAAVAGKYWFEKLARIPVAVDIASEWRYRQPPLKPNHYAMFISQSGETMDTLEAMRYAKTEQQKILSLVNVPDSSLARASDHVFYTKAGAEIGVASTKAFLAQLLTMLLLAIDAGKQKQTISQEKQHTYNNALDMLPGLISAVLMTEDSIISAAKYISTSRHVLFLGRGSCYAIACEGALKLKELSYIHAESYAAGEMKHGPIALLDENMPIVFLAPPDELYEKTLSNLMESTARGAKVIVVSNNDHCHDLMRMDNVIATIAVPTCDDILNPILYTIIVQLLAYHTAIFKGTDIDQPRNLAKSVTVE